MNMPVQHRKLWIRRHNYENELREKEAEERKSGGKTISGEAMNAFASMEQEKAKNQKKLLS